MTHFWPAGAPARRGCNRISEPASHQGRVPPRERWEHGIERGIPN